MSTTLHAALIILVMALVTILLRALPFLLFGGKKGAPPYILYLGRVLPAAIIAMLVVYCLKDIQLAKAPYGAAEIIASLATVGLHVWKRNSVISILGGTLIYMLLVQVVF